MSERDRKRYKQIRKKLRKLREAANTEPPREVRNKFAAWNYPGKRRIDRPTPLLDALINRDASNET
jgi:hypothetical protein